MTFGILVGLSQFLLDYPMMAVRPSRGESVIITGKFTFSATSQQHGTITDVFDLSISVPRTFPHDVPKITETAGRIPRDGKHHTNPDGTLCLGSPIRLQLKLLQKPTLSGFVESCLVPYLFSISHKLQHGGPFVFNELAHGRVGALADYGDILGLKKEIQTRVAIEMLGLRKRIANKRPCPCDCGLRLGKCRLNRKLAELRRLKPRSWFKKQAFG